MQFDRRCCQRVNYTGDINIPEGKKCVLDDPKFIECITNEYTHYLFRRFDNSKCRVGDPMGRKRFYAYCVTTTILHGYLGPNVRIPMPLCVEAFVKEFFPRGEKDPQHVGFKEAGQS